MLENRLEESLGGAPGEKPRKRLPRSRSRFSTPSRNPTPTPGGGSVAALAGALGASLGQMVADTFAQEEIAGGAREDRLRIAAKNCDARRRRSRQRIDRDAASYESVLTAHRLPRATPEEQNRRNHAIQQALMGAIERATRDGAPGHRSI